MANPVSRLRLDRLTDNPVVRVVAYYVLLVGGVTLLVQLVPGLEHVFSSERAEDMIRLGGAGGRRGDLSGLLQDATPPFASGPLGPPLAAAVAMVGASLLMLPVAWVYTMTRQKKGYKQALVQTLIVLPAVVAGVVILVKNSLALAFSLAGIVAAVNFRNTLRDTKDAVYIFLSMAIGLAAGVQIMPVALIISVIFNAMVLLLTWTDFGRAPAPLEGARARARLDRARALAGANRTGMFVSVLGREVLKSLSPEQLDALVDRAERQKARFEPPVRADDEGNGAAPKPLDTTLRIYAADPGALRASLEAVLATQAKAWRFDHAVEGPDGTAGLEYKLRLRKKVPADLLLAQLRERGGPDMRAELV
jgi:Domain of unknown function (DUF4956)